MDAQLLLRQIVEMQIELNDRTVENWMDKHLDWDSAILVEVAEAIDSTDWKWWKHGTTDLPNLRIEAVDLLHFLISKALTIHHEADYIVRNLVEIVENQQPNQLDELSWLKQVALYTLENKVLKALHALFNLFTQLGMDLSAIHQAYISKNLLNHYRQERGYKDPNAQYLKIIGGEEDNQVFARVVKQQSEQAEDLAHLKERVFVVMDQCVARARQTG